MVELTWILAGLSIFGVILNIKKVRWCFWIWAFTNAGWAVVDFIMGIYAQATLFVVYFALAVWGIIAWRK